MKEGTIMMVTIALVWRTPMGIWLLVAELAEEGGERRKRLFLHQQIEVAHRTEMRLRIMLVGDGNPFQKDKRRDSSVTGR
jgi:hypothetical protein